MRNLKTILINYTDVIMVVDVRHNITIAIAISFIIAACCVFHSKYIILNDFILLANQALASVELELARLQQEEVLQQLHQDAHALRHQLETQQRRASTNAARIRQSLEYAQQRTHASVPEHSGACTPPSHQARLRFYLSPATIRHKAHVPKSHTSSHKRSLFKWIGRNMMRAVGVKNGSINLDMQLPSSPQQLQKFTKKNV